MYPHPQSPDSNQALYQDRLVFRHLNFQSNFSQK